MVIIIILTWKTINIISLNSHLKRLIYSKIGASQVERVVKNLTATAGDIRDAGLMFGPRRSPGEGHGNLLQCSLPGESHGRRSLVSYSPWSCKELDMTEATCQALSPHKQIWNVGAVHAFQLSTLDAGLFRGVSVGCLLFCLCGLGIFISLVFLLSWTNWDISVKATSHLPARPHW